MHWSVLCAQCSQARCNLTLATIVLKRHGYPFLCETTSGQERLVICSFNLPLNETQSQESNLACSLKNPSSSVQQFLLKISFPETSLTLIPLHCGGLVCEKVAEDGCCGRCLTRSPWGSPHSSGVSDNPLFAAPLSIDSSIDSALGSLCPGCPPHPFCWYIPRTFKFTPKLQPWLLGLRTGCEHLPWCS